MSPKNKTEVLIAGKIYTLSGYESEEYLQKVATYINNKITEFNKMDGFKRQSKETKSVLLDLNIADDYFKAKRQVEVVEEDLEIKDKELYDLKHELIAVQIKLENAEKSMGNSNSEINELQKKIVKLETELHENRRR
jgi:Cell division protein ZapA.